MKAQFLKIAGVKSEKEFYDKYPTEEQFFAKCGAKIKKAYPGMKIPKAQNGFMENLTGGEGVGGALMNFGGGNPVQKIMDISSGFKAQREKVNQANQNMQVMGHLEDATTSNSMFEQQTLQNNRINSYVRPEDNVITGNELFPMQGVGTNVLAKNGKKINAAGGFLGTSGSMWGNIGKQALGTGVNMGIQALGGGDDMGSQLGGDLLGTIGSATGIPGMGQVGKLVGSVVGDLFDGSDKKIANYNRQADQSLNNMVGMKMGNKIQNNFGGNLQNGGIIPQEGQEDVETYGNGGIMPISQNPYGGEMGMIQGPSHANGGVDMNVNGVPLEAEGGEPIYDNSEGDKIIAGNLSMDKDAKKYLQDITGESFSGTKYKSIAKSIGKKEEKINKKIAKLVEKAEKYDANSKLGKISLKTLELNKSIEDKKLASLQKGKDFLGQVQEIENENLEKAKNGKKIYAQTGKSVERKYKYDWLDPNWGKAEGKTDGFGDGSDTIYAPLRSLERRETLQMPSALWNMPEQQRDTIKPSTTEPTINNVGWPEPLWEPSTQEIVKPTVDKLEMPAPLWGGNNYSDKEPIKEEEEGVISGEELGLTPVTSLRKKPTNPIRKGQDPLEEGETNATAIAIKQNRQHGKGSNNLYGDATIKDLRRLENQANNQKWWKDMGIETDFTDPETLRKFQTAFIVNNPSATRLIVDGKFGDQMSSITFKQNKKKTEARTKKKKWSGQTKKNDPTPIEISEPEKEKENKWDFQIPSGFNLRGTDAEDFNSAQLLPEAWAMANNKLEPVQAQKFNTRLRTPYDISFQDQLNLNTSKARAAERMASHNPGMLANLKAQEYMADQGVLGNQFRTNQQFKDQVYSGNLQALNTANLKNLAIADQQYVRQEKAKSNTKSTDFEALKSMTDKRLKHNLENQQLRVLENLYDYRYNDDGRANYRGPLADFYNWKNGQSNTEPKKGKKQPSLSTPGIKGKNGLFVKQLKKIN